MHWGAIRHEPGGAAGLQVVSRVGRERRSPAGPRTACAIGAVKAGAGRTAGRQVGRERRVQQRQRVHDPVAYPGPAGVQRHKAVGQRAQAGVQVLHVLPAQQVGNRRARLREVCIRGRDALLQGHLIEARAGHQPVIKHPRSPMVQSV